MKIRRCILWVLIPIIILAYIACWLWIHYERERKNTIIFGTSATIPPMTFYRENVEFSRESEIIGFEVDLAKLLAEKLGKRLIIKYLSTASLDGAVINGIIDAYFNSVCFLTHSEAQNLDMPYNWKRWEACQASIAYHKPGMAVLYRKDHPITNEEQLRSVSKIASDNYRVAEAIAIKKLAPQAQISYFDGGAVEALEVGAVECAFVDLFIAQTQCHGNAAFGIKGNQNLDYFDCELIKTSGIRMSFNKKRCPGVRDRFNQILKEMDASGELQKLREKWGLREKWKLKDDELSTQE